MQSCKSCMLLSLLRIEDDDPEEAPSELFNLCKLSSNCDTSGWGADGKLLLRRCRELAVFVSMTAIFFFLENRRKSEGTPLNGVQPPTVRNQRPVTALSSRSQARRGSVSN
ncbi:unnamed protein product [Trifolium pratense]|uniref:Uncharacterized protein n=1 Tax=Trifolium pratense TaxID=57577 RepID=A0ACB0MBK5_TRIPR|nr:unnamed protein product [Trifolium pratense]